MNDPMNDAMNDAMNAEHDAEVDLIKEALGARDVAAFVRRDWSMIADDFDASTFVGYRAVTESDGWELAFPSLPAYRDEWLRQAAELADRGIPDLEAELLARQEVGTVQIVDDRALARKVCDGALHGPAGPIRMDWVTHYFLRRSLTGRWQITGFVGCRPHAGAPVVGPARITRSVAAQHATAGPYAPALRVTPGDLVVISGQGPLDADGVVVGTDIAEQAAVTLANCERQLAAAGATFADVFKCNVYLTDLAHWDAFNAVYRATVGEPFPVRTAVGTELVLGMLVEIEMWAAP